MNLNDKVGDFTILEYSQHIKRDNVWSETDYDINILAKMLGDYTVNISMNEHTELELGGEYRVCNLNNEHWMLKKGGVVRNFVNDSIVLEGIIDAYSAKVIGGSRKKTLSLKTKRTKKRKN